MVTLINQLRVLCYLNTYDHDFIVNQLLSDIESKRSVKTINNSNNTFENEWKLLIDGGCGRSLAGNEFITESQTNRSVDVQGCFLYL